MIWTCIDYQLDFLGFAACCLLGVFVLGRLVEHCRRENTAYLASAFLTLLVLIAGFRSVYNADADQRCNLINHMSAFATTYAGETEKLGHGQLSDNALQTEPAYLQLVDAQRRWLQANSLVSDIYTMRRKPDGRTLLIVDSETDYDRSGRIDADREQRTAPGEEYSGFSTPLQAEAFEDALRGSPAFIAAPYKDRWGQWVSALHPLFDKDGNVEGVLGVDFPAAVWGQQIFNARLSVIGILAVIESLLLTGASIVTLTRFHLSQQRAAAEKLQQFKTTLDQTLDSVFMFRPTDYRFIYVNEGARQLLGYTEQQYLEMTPLNIVPDMTMDGLKKLVQPLVDGTHQLFTFETLHRHVDGHDVPVELSLQFVSQQTDTPRFVGIVRDITERKKIEKELLKAARLDRLTGLPNRALFNDRLKLYIENARQKPGYRFALMFLDFDRFKIVNDSLGHEAGDTLLKEIASRLTGNLGTSDSISTLADGTTVSRLGGDEFVVIVDNIDGPETVCQVARRLLSALGEQYQLGEHQVRSTASIGIVCSNPGYVNAEDMIRDADTAMYEAKARGKGCYVVFDDSMREAAQKRLQMENDLRIAISQDQLKLAWQPVIDLETGAVDGVEALIRWDHPALGMLLPHQFLEIAEESRLILPVSDWVLHQACRQFVQWKRAAGAAAPRYVSINLSGRQLMIEQLEAQLLSVAREYRMRPEELQLEVTEAKLIEHRETSAALLPALARTGFRLAIDDFGTGYSSLACLQQYPFRVLKMDRTFLSDCGRGHDMMAVANSIVRLAENLGIQCVAEGIEDDIQFAILKSINCRFGQGHLLCRPLPASEFTDFLQLEPMAAPLELAAI
ncbi:MAG: EAL domain-containing protein [Planctomycetaceae bacterium]